MGAARAADKPPPAAAPPPGAAAHKKGMVPEEGAVELMLLWQKSVRDDLKLTDDESMKVHDFIAGQWKKAKALEGAADAEQDQKFDELTRENEQFLKETLQPEQSKRLEQIALQTAGLLWVTRPHIADQLKLPDDQKKQAHDLQQKARQEVDDLLNASDREAKKEDVQKLRETSHKRLMELLTDDQKAKWKEMAGEPFKGEFHFKNVGTSK